MTEFLPAADVADLRRRVDAGFDEVVANLSRLVAIPSFATPSAPPRVLDRSAEAVVELLRAVGVGDARIVRLRSLEGDGEYGAPGVIGRIPAPEGAPTVLLYAHHDVQPVADDWQTEPFTATIKNGRLYGRGASDDKAGVVVHVAALKALAEDLGVGVALFIEGEEESGSPNFVEFLDAYREDLAADVVVVADSGNWTATIPALTVSLRGVATLTVSLSVLDHAVHSGEYSGPVLDAPLLLARLIATLHDEAGDLAVEGLGQTGVASVDYAESDYRRDAGLLDGVPLVGTGSIADRLWWKPTVTLIGFDTKSVDEASNTIHPSARARLSLRIPPGLDGMEAAKALQAHLEGHVPFGAKVAVEINAVGHPYAAGESSHAVDVVRWALTTAYGADVVDRGEGGTIPLVPDLLKVFPDIEVLITGFSDPDTRAHAGNESVDLGSLKGGVLAEVLLLAAMAR